ncbi:hypothetical protein ACJW30_12G053500 [Castanea mollissima]
MGLCLKLRKSHVISVIVILGILTLRVAECRNKHHHHGDNGGKIEYPAINCRKHSAVLTDFGAVGDGKTSNTKAFNAAIQKLSTYASDGGAQLIVPPGKWLTGSFNLTSHFTLFLHEDAVILGSQDESEWPAIPVLPSYGRGRDAPSGRLSALISGSNLTDVVITGNNGTIDGQGSTWWKKFRAGELNMTRPYMIEIMYSDQIQISNLTLINSPSWFVHPIYSSNVLVKGLTILAPVDSPNTDGVDPDSCTNTRIEDCFIVSGDDCIAVKSGWDEYGIKVGMPTQHLIIRRLTCISPDSATIALGSEMSGGIQDVRAEDITAINTESGVRIKTAIGRGGYVKDIYVRRMTLKTMKYVFWMAGNYNQHPDPKYDPKAIPEIKGINYRDVVAENVTYSAKLDGIQGDPFTGICISNVTITLTEKPKKLQWNCTDIAGVTSIVTPTPCALLPEKQVYQALNCRKHTAVLTDFGAVGDGKTLNTKVFNAAIRNLSRYALDGGAQLIVPPGRWLTGSFNLTSHFTLFIEKMLLFLEHRFQIYISVITSQLSIYIDETQWPPLPVLPSYGRGRDVPGGRLSALIFGTNLTDVVITGNNGTIDGQGATWWTKYRAKEYNVTRPYLIELMYSNQIQISNLTLLDSPSWFVLPIYSSDIIVKGLTIIASIYSANTDGIDPDSCSNVRSEDCYIVSGDDCIAKIFHLIIRRVTCISPFSALIALGSEMSGGIQDVRAEDITAIDTESAVRVKTALGRGDVVATNVTFAGRLDGITGDPFTGICISNVTMTMNLEQNKLPWNCTDISGVTSKVTPKPCASLPEKQGVNCAFPTDRLPIEDVQLKTCTTIVR